MTVEAFPEPSTPLSGIQRSESFSDLTGTNGGDRRTPLETGVWGEALAIAWLADRGYEVFCGFGNTSCDFLALRDGLVTRVEAKVSHGFRAKMHVNSIDPAKFDLLLVVRGSDGMVFPNPGIDIATGVPCEHHLLDEMPTHGHILRRKNHR